MASSSSQQEAHDNGSLCWLEIPVLSTTRAAAFYTAIFGWDCTYNNNNNIYSNDDDDDMTLMSESDEEDAEKSNNINHDAPPQTCSTSMQMFHCPAGSSSSSSSSSNNTRNNDVSIIRGVFIQVPEECLVRTWDAGRTGKMAVLTTFSVHSIEETLRRVVEMGGRVHVPKTSIGGDTGYFARFVDSEGNLQGIWARD